MAVTFHTTILQAEGLNATGISVPPDLIASLGSNKRPPVVITLNGYSYRTTVAAYGDVFMVPLNQEHRNAAGVKAGDQVDVTIDLDTEPRTVELPDDLVAALDAKPGARAAFDGLSYSKRKEFVRQVNDAKTQATREKRIASVVEKMGDA
jgi:hypothetical protein